MMKKTLLYISLIFLFASCEKVIHVDLNEANPRIVVDGGIKFNENIPNGVAVIQLHWTNGFYDPLVFKTLDNADIKITDFEGTVSTVPFVSNGAYYASNIKKGPYGSNYKLEILVDGRVITSSSTLLRQVNIDSLSYEINNFNPNKSGYTVNCHFTDPAGEKNYYYLKLLIDSTYQPGYFITRDDALDGKQITYTFYRNLIESSAHVQVELYTLDEPAFEYFKVLAMMQQGGMSTAPGNPPSNIEGDAIGIFRCVFADGQNMIMP